MISLPLPSLFSPSFFFFFFFFFLAGLRKAISFVYLAGSREVHHGVEEQQRVLDKEGGGAGSRGGGAQGGEGARGWRPRREEGNEGVAARVWEGRVAPPSLLAGHLKPTWAKAQAQVAEVFHKTPLFSFR